MGHVKYMLGDTEVAKDCYERTINFVRDASEMHSIYLRLASIYLQESKVPPPPLPPPALIVLESTILHVHDTYMIVHVHVHVHLDASTCT